MEQLHPEAEDQRRAPETTDFDGLDAHDFDAGTYGDDWRAYPDATEHVAPARSGFARTSLWIGLPGLLIVGAVGAFWTLGPW
ncbi:MAG: hypothetical protein KGQ28_08755, partial [Hyphomicrobiales bacterium]|nr:hypothetical protein [Hyphomicrobiales bacterium]